MTVTLYKYIRSELIEKGLNEFVDSQGNLIFFEQDDQFLTKILTYDEDVSTIVDKLFTGVSLTNRAHDDHFKKGFLMRFLNRRINKQTIDAFRVSLLMTYIPNERYINSVYSDLDRYIHLETLNDQTNKQKSEALAAGETITDNRQAFANLPQNNVQLDVNSTIMTTASDNTISRNKMKNDQSNTNLTDGETASTNRTYRLDELFKLNGIEERIYNEFDRTCFMQVW